MYKYFVYFKTSFLEFRRQYKVFAVFLQKLEPCTNGAYSAAIFKRFCIENGWRYLCHSIYCTLFADVTSIRCETPVLEVFACFAEEEKSHDRKAVAVTCTEGYVVGHLPREISGLCFHFIHFHFPPLHGGKINGEITGRRQHMKADFRVR